jgi:ribosomal protein S20
MKRRTTVPVQTRAQLIQGLVISGVAVVCTVLVALVQMYFLETINGRFVSEVATPEEVIGFLRAEESYIYYGLIAFLSLTLVSMFVLTARFTNRVFGPARSMDRDLKKLIFLSQFRTEVNVRREDLIHNLIRQYRLTSEDLDTIHKLYFEAYREIDEELKKQSISKKKAA